MKNYFIIAMKSVLTSLCLALCYQGYGQLPPNVFWDNNGTTAPTDGNWDTNSLFWNVDTNLATASPFAFTNGNFAAFTIGAGTMSAAINITVPGQVACTGIGDGAPSCGTVTTLTFNGPGPIIFPAGAQWSIDCNGSIVMNTPMTGPGGITQHGGSALHLDDTNTYSGGTTITGGQLLYYNNSASFGTGTNYIVFGNSSMSVLLDATGPITLPNPWYVVSGVVFNFGNGNTICTGPWTLGESLQLKNNGSSNSVVPNPALVISGPISESGGHFGLDLQCDNPGGSITFSGANTYSGPTMIGDGGVGSTTILTVSNINSVANPPQMASSSLGVPDNAVDGTIYMGSNGYGATLIYVGNQPETSDRTINLASTTGPDAIQMNGTGPLVLTGGVTATGNGSKTLTLEGTSTAANTISGAIANHSGSSTTALTKSQAGTWILTATNTFTGGLTINAGTLTIGGAGDLNSGSYAGAFADKGIFNYDSTVNQTLSGTLSGAGTFNMAGGGNTTLTLSGGSSSFTGLFTITSGTIGIGADVNLGAAPGSVVTNDITLNGGPLANIRANGNFTLNANRGITLGANGGALQAAAANTLTYNGIIGGSGQFQVGINATIGLGVIALGGSESYTNWTILSGGTTRLLAGGSISNSAGILFSNSPTLDVSAQTIAGLSTTNILTVISTSNTPTAPATILGPPGSSFSLGAQTVNLSYNPAWVNGDASHSVLTVSQCELVLNGNTINVTNATGSTLDVGNYALITCANGFVISTAPVLNYVGNLAPHTVATLAVVNGSTLALQILPGSGYSSSTFINQSPYPGPSATYGTTSVSVSGKLVKGGSYPASGETVTIGIPNVGTNTTTISDSTGDFSGTVTSINTAPVGTYPIDLSYAGPTLASALDSSLSLTVTKAPITVTANAQSKNYGSSIPTGAGQTAFTSSSLSNSETIGTVSLAVSGSPSGAQTNASVAGSPYTITPSAATGGTFNINNYSITYATAHLTVNPLPVGLTGTRVYDTTATAAFNILSLTNKGDSTDVVTFVSGSVTLNSATPGIEPVTSASGLTLGGVSAPNYTTTGATGAVTITPYTDPTNIVTSVANNVLTLSWSLDHTGWTLEAQTNSVSVGLGSNWVPVTGSTATNQMTFTIDPSQGCVFYELLLP